MHHFNGVTCIPDSFWSQPDLFFSTDSSLKAAGGWSPAQPNGRNDNQFFSVRYPQRILMRAEVNINELEALALLVGVKLWAASCKGRKILVNCDNQVTVHIVNSGRAANTFAQACMRELHYWCARFDCQVRAVFIDTKRNTMADLLSRSHDPTCVAQFQDKVKHLKIRELKVVDSMFDFIGKW